MNTATSAALMTAHETVRLMIRSMSYRWYRRIAMPIATGQRGDGREPDQVQDVRDRRGR